MLASMRGPSPTPHASLTGLGAPGSLYSSSSGDSVTRTVVEHGAMGAPDPQPSPTWSLWKLLPSLKRPLPCDPWCPPGGPTAQAANFLPTALSPQR